MTSTNSISKIIVLVIGLFLAIMMANLLVTDKLVAFAWLGLAAVLITGLALGRNIWMLIPFAGALGLTLMIPGRPDTMLLGHAMFVGFSSLLFLMRRLPWQFKFTELDFWALILALFIGQVYARNPVGVNILGGDSVGGRPYFIVAVTYVSYFLLSNMMVAAHRLKWILRLTIAGGVISFFMNLVGYFVPGVGMWYGAAGQGTSQMSDGAEGSTTETGVGRAGRIGFLGNSGRSLALWVVSFKSPLKACFHPLWGSLLLLSLTFAALSGFRNQIVAVGLTYIVGILYRGGFVGLIIAVFGLMAGIGVLAVTNTIAPLPANVQRALSFLPGTWDDDIRRSAEGSTDWRVEIWEEVLLTDRWISNKWLGDGLGFSAQELRVQASLADGTAGISGFDAHRENILSSGDYHSGPVQAIRVIGYFGLFFLLLAQIRLAVHAHRLIKRCKHTEWLPLAIIVGIPVIWYPFFFVFVYGTFSQAMAGYLLGAAMIKLLQHNLPFAVNTPQGQPTQPPHLHGERTTA